MILKRKTYADPVSRNKWVENANGKKPFVVFDDEGAEVAVVMDSMFDSGTDKTIRFEFSECNPVPVLATESEVDFFRVVSNKSVYSNNHNVINVVTGVVHRFTTADLDENGDLLPDLMYEYDYHVEAFGKNVSASSSMYEKIQDFMAVKFANGLNGNNQEG